MTLTPRPYQLVGRDFLASRTRALLADEMRVGKTPQAILAAGKVGAEKITVVCPAIAAPQWYREFARWWPYEHWSPEVQVLSYDRARLDAERLVRESRDVLIVDECHFAKNPEAQRTKLIYGRGGIGWTTSYLWALSGTPAPKHAGELWPMLRAFGVVGMQYGEFIRRYCYFSPDDVTRSRPIGTREKYIPELKALLTKVMMRRTRREVAPEMPEIDFQFMEVEPLGVDLIVPSGFDDDAVVEWVKACVSAEDRQAVATAKVAPLVEHITFAIENGLLKQTVVFGWHKVPLVKLAYELETRGLRVGVITGETPLTVREKVQAAFREGQLQVVCANILAAGTAIDLSAASHAYFLELDWVSGNNVQAANRLVSLDKQEPVTVDVMTWPGSVDDRVQRVLMRRAKEINQLV